jgi:hypothetical protein
VCRCKVPVKPLFSRRHRHGAVAKATGAQIVTHTFPGRLHSVFKNARRAARYALEQANVTLDEAQLVLTGLAGLRQPDRKAPALALIAVFSARKRPDLERPFRRLLGNEKN